MKCHRLLFWLDFQNPSINQSLEGNLEGMVVHGRMAYLLVELAVVGVINSPNFF